MNSHVNKLRLSVLVTAYKRREFIREALESVLNQTTPKDVYEIICITAFHDEGFSIFLKENNIKEIFCDGKMGERLALGIEASNNEIIVFLEDDDKFREDKLENIISVFERYSCVYYHNNVELIDANSQIILERVDPYYRQISRSFLWIPVRGYRNILKHRGDFNMSSVAVKKKIIDKNMIEILRQIESSPDTIIFFLLMQLNLQFYFHAINTTLYRVHDSETNNKNIDPEKIMSSSLKYYRSRLIAYESIYSNQVKKLFFAILLESKFGAYIVGKTEFKPTATEILKFFYMAISRPSIFYLRLWVATILYEFFPSYVDKVRYKRISKKYSAIK